MAFLLTETELAKSIRLSIVETSGRNGTTHKIIESYKIKFGDKPLCKYKLLKENLQHRVKNLNTNYEQAFRLMIDSHPDNSATVWLYRFGELIYTIRYSPTNAKQQIEDIVSQCDEANDCFQTGQQFQFSFIPTNTY